MTANVTGLMGGLLQMDELSNDSMTTCTKLIWERNLRRLQEELEEWQNSQDPQDKLGDSTSQYKICQFEQFGVGLDQQVLYKKAYVILINVLEQQKNRHQLQNVFLA